MLSTPLNPRRTREPRRGFLLTVSVAGVLAVWLHTGPGSECHVVPHHGQRRKLHEQGTAAKMTAKFNSYGPRIPGSTAHDKAIAWLETQGRARAQLRSDLSDPTVGSLAPFQARTRSHFGGAGGIRVTRLGGPKLNVPDAGAVHWSQPTAKSGKGRTACLPAALDQEITTENSAGGYVWHFPIGSLPFGAVGPLLGLYLTPDLAGYTEYTRPYLRPLPTTT